MAALTIHSWGPSDAPLLVLLHGFMGTGADWAPVAHRLDQDFQVLAPDLPGHGGSVGGPDSWYTLEGAAVAIARISARSFVLAGYSMGGRLALEVALRSDRVQALGLFSAHTGIAREADRQNRRRADEERAASLREDFDGFLHRWFDQPMFSGLPKAAFVRRRLAHGRPAELARALVGFSTGRQTPRLDELKVPVREVVGGADPKYVELAGPRARVIPDAGHNLPAEQPRAVAAALRELHRNRHKAIR